MYARKIKDYEKYASAAAQCTRRERLGLIFPAPLGHLLVGGDARPGTKFLLASMVIITLILMPLIWLVYTQTKFLVYQNEYITYLHRIIIIIDLSLLWWLWPRIVAPNLTWREWWIRKNSKTPHNWFKSQTYHLTRNTVTITFSFAILIFIFIIVAIPDGLIDRSFPLQNTREKIDQNYVYRFYRFPGRTFVRDDPPAEILAAYISKSTDDNRNIDAPGGIAWRKHGKPMQLTQRNFRKAQLSSSYFFDSDLRWTDFSRANLWRANFREVEMYSSYFQGTFLELASFQQANLSRSMFQGASMKNIRLEGTRLADAIFHGANLQNAQLEGADLRRANFVGANLTGANLRGALLIGADLRGAILTNAQLTGADLREAWVGGTRINAANLRLADLRNIKLDEPDQNFWESVERDISDYVKNTGIEFNILKNISQRRRDVDVFDLSKAAQLDGSICDDKAPFKQHCKFKSNQEEVFFKDLIPFLSDELSCPEGASDVAAGIAYRIHRRYLIDRSSSAEKAAFSKLARKLTSKACRGAHDLAGWLRDPITRGLGNADTK